MAVVYRVLLERLGGTNVSTYKGKYGDLFYDPATTTLRVADGETAGGTPLPTGGGSGPTSSISAGAETTVGISSTSVYINAYLFDDETEEEIYTYWTMPATGLASASSSEDEIGFYHVGKQITLGNVDITATTAVGSLITSYTFDEYVVAQLLSRETGAKTMTMETVANLATDKRYARISSYDGGVYGEVNWIFDQTGKTTFPIALAPASSIGTTGDTVGMVAFTQSYWYFCVANYDGASNIWRRQAWNAGDTW